MVMFLLTLVKGSKSAEGGKNPLADMDRGSKSARTPGLQQQLQGVLRARPVFEVAPTNTESYLD